jgi:hypothetical protein
MSLIETTAERRTDIVEATTDDLKRRLAEAITVTARGLYETALIFEELQRRGEPVEDMRLALAPYLPKIARGEIAAEAVIGLAGFRTALDRVALLPPERQREVVTAEYAVISGGGGDNAIVVRRRIAEMSAREVKLLISEDGRILSPDAQAEVLRLAPKGRSSAGGGRRLPRGRQPKIAIQGEYVIVGRQAVRTDHLIDSLRALGALK